SVAAIESQNNFAALRSGSYFRLPTAHKNIYFLFFKKIFSCTSFVNLASVKIKATRTPLGMFICVPLVVTARLSCNHRTFYNILRGAFDVAHSD
ncbi:MAG: hypothetical protein J6N71_11425, partial [Muribaculaceae bacterium]|nr:hypothetical protein [Muribaculaceae bacterium]